MTLYPFADLIRAATTKEDEMKHIGLATRSLAAGYTPLQVRYGNDPYTGRRHGWRVLTICIMLNQTGNRQVEPVLQEFFTRFPYAVYAEVAAYSPRIHERMEAVLEPLGLKHIRTTRIAMMSNQWVEHVDWRSATKVPFFAGCDRYASDAWRIFIDEDYTQPAEDSLLEAWRQHQIRLDLRAQSHDLP